MSRQMNYKSRLEAITMELCLHVGDRLRRRCKQSATSCSPTVGGEPTGEAATLPGLSIVGGAVVITTLGAGTLAEFFFPRVTVSIEHTALIS